ncbi:MAG: SusE domain-containing protein [Bacteroidota bacterium]|nr:SusE domain-containing protein [Bacteroidota bacterium]
MKKLSIIAFSLGLLVFLFSCKKDETKATISSSPGAPVLNLTSGMNIVINKAYKDSTVTFTWSKADFGLNLVVSYTLQMDKQGKNFSDPVAVGVVQNDLSLSLTYAELNNKLLSIESDPTNPIPEAMSLEFRVKASVSDYSSAAYSAAIPQTYTPFYVPIVYPILFVPGDYQGWNPADSSTTIASVKSNNLYEGYIWFPNDNVQFKYTQGNSWTTNWGDNGADGTLDPGGANIVAGPAGYYKLNVNLSSLTHSFLRTSWSVYGSAAGNGSTDYDMTYDVTNKVWTVSLSLSTGTFKFRANHSNTLTYGDTKGNGTLVESGTEISVANAGNYTVTLDLSQPVYRYKLKQD